MRIEELRAFRRDVAATFPILGDRYAGDLVAVPVEQPWFKRHQLLRLDVLQATGLSLYGARGQGTVALLSGRLDHLAEMVSHEPPRGLDDESCAAYAEDCDRWTAPYDIRPILVRSIDDIARRVRVPGALVGISKMADALERELQAARVTHSGGDRVVTCFVLCGVKLLRRRLTVKPDGALRREDEEFAAHLPLVSS